MFTFAYPGLLFLLLLLPAIALLFGFSRIWRRKKLERMGSPSVLHMLMPDLSPYKAGVRLAVALLALFGIIFALARPWGGVRNQETNREGIEIVIAVDASNSMLASATNDEKGPDRMRMAKLVLEKLINRLGNDRVGLIAFAGDAYTLIPVTNDYVSAKAFLNSIDPSMIAHQGTNIATALNLAKNSFSEKGDIGKAIILLTDAEELEDQQGVLMQVAQAAKTGIQTDVIGIGSAPVTIPDEHRGRMVDEETGEVVKTALNEDLAVEIASAGKGIYVNASNDDAIDELMKQLSTLKRAAMESSFLVTHDELYFPFVILALVMLIIDFIITDKKNRWLDRINFFGRDRISVFLIAGLACAVSFGSCSKGETEVYKDNEDSLDISYESKRDSLLQIYSLENERNYILTGNMHHMAGNLEKADSNYRAALTVNPRSIVASLNSGVNAVREVMRIEMGSSEGQPSDSVVKPLVEKARKAFADAATPMIEKGGVSSMAFYNQGNLQFIQDQYAESIESYKEALRLNPDDDHARRNLRIAQLQKKENNQDQNQPQQQNQESEEDRQNQQEQQSQPDRQNINDETSEQILQAAERKENQRRMQIKAQEAQQEERRHQSGKKW